MITIQLKNYVSPPRSSFDNIHLCPNRQIVDELIQSCLSVIYTKIYELNVFYMVRHITLVRNNTRNLIVNKNNIELKKSKDYLKKVVIESILESELINYSLLEQNVENSIDKFFQHKNNVFSNYFLFLNKFLLKLKNILNIDYNSKKIVNLNKKKTLFRI